MPNIFTSIPPENNSVIFSNRNPDEILYSEPTKSYIYTYYNNNKVTSLNKQTQEIKFAYLNENGIEKIKDHYMIEQAFKASEQFSREMREATVGIK